MTAQKELGEYLLTVDVANQQIKVNHYLMHFLTMLEEDKFIYDYFHNYHNFVNHRYLIYAKWTDSKESKVELYFGSVEGTENYHLEKVVISNCTNVVGEWDLQEKTVFICDEYIGNYRALQSVLSSLITKFNHRRL